MDEESYPELENFPNRALVNAHRPGAGPLGASTGLAERHEHLRLENQSRKAEASAAKELAKLRNQLLGSKWFALGRALGGCKKITADAGKTPGEKLANLKKAIADSKWLKLGGGKF